MSNPIQAMDPNDQNVVEFGESPGRRLRVQRQSRGLAVERIASQLHLKPEIIEALEQDRFDLLPGPVFVTGYLRNYARILGLDPSPLISAYRSHGELPKELAPRRPLPGAAPASGATRFMVRLVSLALLGAVVTLTLLWWRDRPELGPEPELGSIADAWSPDSAQDAFLDSPATDGPGSDVEADLAATRADDPGPADAAPVADESGAEEGADGDASRTAEGPPTMASEGSAPSPGAAPPDLAAQRPGIAAPHTDATERPTEGRVDAPTTPADGGALAADRPTTGGPEERVAGSEPPTPAGIILEFDGPSWLEVRDAGGTRLIIGEMRAGERREIKGQAPFRFTIGRVSNTRMTVDGKPFDLEGRSTGNVARFAFDPSAPE